MLIRIHIYLVILHLALPSLSGSEVAGGGQSLFDGKTLGGWKIRCKPEDQPKSYWRVEDGCIVADSMDDPVHDTVWLETDQEFDDFELRLKFQAFRDSPGNSGVQFRSRYNDDVAWLEGPQLDIHPPGPWRTGMIYDETRGVQKWIAPALAKAGDAKPEMAAAGSKFYYSDDSPAWNDLEVTARGTHVRVVLNGVVVRDWNGAGVLDDATHRGRNVGMRGHIALQIHKGDRLKIRFKDIALRELAGPASNSSCNPGTPWPATDALGRSLPVTHEPDAIRPERCVGIFYFLWHDQPWNSQQVVHPPNDLAKILPQDPDILNKPDSPLWGVPGDPYYWGEPLYGYYHISDPWVLRRHASLLADAGIDTVIFDTTNRATYRSEYMKLCEVWTQVRKEGGRTPRICFMVNTQAGETAKEIYNDLYKPGLYKDLWFTWQDKPLMICDPEEATPELMEFFTLRKAHWPFELVNTKNAWHWEATYPQVYSYDQDPARPEQVNVAVAQNLRISDGKVTNMSEGDARGRSFHSGKRDTSPGAVNQGHNFEEQWQRAHELNPPFVMVTGWNEWIAGKFSRPGRPVVFVDQYDQEHSRDIEPVTGLHNDNYYYQLVANVRRYKGHPQVPAATPETTIDLATGFAQWQEVGPEFTDHVFDNGPRDFGQGARKYQNKSGRNDIVAAKVARDSSNFYFQVRTRDPLTPISDPNWMWLLIDADQDPKTGWEGYDFIVNRMIEGGQSWLEKHTGGWNWMKVGRISVQVSGNHLMLMIPRDSLGLESMANLNFKWWDNPQNPGDIMDVYLSGDTAPDGRFSYHYAGGNSAITRPDH